MAKKKVVAPKVEPKVIPVVSESNVGYVTYVNKTGMKQDVVINNVPHAVLNNQHLVVEEYLEGALLQCVVGRWVKLSK